MKTLFLALLVTATFACAEVIDEGIGMIYGTNHVFSLKAPKGWVLDNESGVKQGIHAAFFPKGGTWSDSKVVAYARVRQKKDGAPTVAQQVEDTVKHFRENDSPKYEGKKATTVKAEAGKVGEIYHFTGDQWGNFEAVAYFPEEKTINFIVMSVRDEKTFKDALPAFEELAKSYRFIGEKVEVQKDAPPDKKPKKKPAK
jgi:hypothetical protein